MKGAGLRIVHTVRKRGEVEGECTLVVKGAGLRRLGIGCRYLLLPKYSDCTTDNNNPSISCFITACNI